MKALIRVNATSKQPKYQQIISSISEAVQNNVLKKGEQIPSINQLCEEFSLSRETALTAYKELKSKGIISASPGKGYYIATDTIKTEHKIFLLFDELNAFKEILYNSFKESIGEHGKVEIYFHHYNHKIFESLIEDNLGNYTSYVIMPIPDLRFARVLEKIPYKKLFLLDVGRNIFPQHFASVCQDFKTDVINGLTSGLDLLKKYKKLILVFPDIIQNPKDIIIGFETFTRTNRIKSEIIYSLKNRKLKSGEAYFVIDDKDLVFIVKEARENKIPVGKEIGIISYNDTPLKEVVANGITTISTDFKKMGSSVAELLLHKKRKNIHNPSTLIKRSSL